MPFHEDDWVEVLSSNSNYKGPGQLLSPAYGNVWLVKIKREDDRPGVIAVRENCMRDRGGPPAQKKDPPVVDDESRYQAEQFAGLSAKQIQRLKRRLAKKQRD